ncbi:MAG: chloride channel protein [Lachnospiraceae bacterium]|nr:chloride channel protein [Lachnospiraceae bacterium]
MQEETSPKDIKKSKDLKGRLSISWLRIKSIVKWILISLIEGVVLGLIGTLFYYCIAWATGFRQSHLMVVLLLPFGAMAIHWIYHITKRDNPGGTNLVLASIRDGQKIPLRMTPLIFISTVFSHFCGASVGREGAALQLGGSVGAFMAKIFRQKDESRRIMVMAGMGAAFSALLGTPLSGAVFAMEITSVGVMYYPALLPSVIAAFTAHRIAILLHQPVTAYSIGPVPEFTLISALKISLVGFASGLAAILFIIALREAGKYAGSLVGNKYLRAFVIGCILLGLTILTGFLEGRPEQYNGAGIDMIEMALLGNSPWYAFLMKILFTALSIAAGYKGGEIVPSFFIGATLGAAIGPLVGLNPALAAAAGMGSVFCGVTNCPLTGLVFLFELFGFKAMPFFILPIAISYVASSYYSLYKTQEFRFKKFV